MNNLLKTASRPQTSKSLLGAVQAQRSFHTPLGTTKSKDDAFKVCQSFFLYLSSTSQYRSTVTSLMQRVEDEASLSATD